MFIILCIYCNFNIILHFILSFTSVFVATRFIAFAFFVCLFVSSIWVFFLKHSQFTGHQGKREGISLIPHYHFHPPHRHLDISLAITAENSPLHIATTTFIKFWDFLMFKQIFLSPQVKRCTIITYKYKQVASGVSKRLNT